MVGRHKNFVIFNIHQKNAESAANEIYETPLSGHPQLIGDHIIVLFSTNCKTLAAEEIYGKQLKNCKDILNKYKIKYKIRKFKG